MKTLSFVRLALVLLPMGLMANPATADTCNANTEAEFQGCLDAAAASAEDSVINLGAGTYSVANNGGMPFTYLVKPACNSGAQAYSLTINGAGAGSTFLDGANLHQALHIRHDRFGVQCWPNPPGTANPNPPGQVDNNNSDANATITVRGVTVRNGRMQPIPAARDQQSSSCGFEDVSEQAGGMAIKVYRAGIVVEDSVFLNNAGVEGGGAKMHKACGATNIQVARNRFENNFTEPAASVNFWYEPATCAVSLTDPGGWSSSSLGSSSPQSGGGAKISARDGRVQVFDNVFVGNATNSGLSTSGSHDGGGLSGKGIFGLGVGVDPGEGSSTPSCPGSTSPWNISGSGGSVWDIERNRFENNVSNGGDGGGAHLWGNMHLADNRFIDNEARVIPGQSDAGDGGGLHIFSKSVFETAILTRNHFLGNEAAGQGGGLQLRSPTTRTDVTASIFSQNSSDGFVWSDGVSEMKLSQGGGGGAFMYTDHGELNFVSNSVCANTATAGYVGTWPRAKGHGGGVVVFAQLSGDDSEKTGVNNRGCKDCVDNVPSGSAAKANIYSNMIWGNNADGLGQDLFIEDVNENEIIWTNGTPSIRDETGSEINLFFNNVGNWLQVCGNGNFAFPDGCTDDLRAHENTALDPQFVDLNLCSVNPNSPAASLTANRNFDPTTVGLPAGSFDPNVFPAADFFGNPFDPDNPQVGSAQVLSAACMPTILDYVGATVPGLDCIYERILENRLEGIANFCTETAPLFYDFGPNVALVIEAFCGGVLVSDLRLKEDVVPVGITESGLPLYRFRYAGGRAIYEGVVAQDVLAHSPEAVRELTGGVLAVDYQRLGLELRIVSPL